jgi:transcriptional regulator with XRE-family HTH domain
MAKKTSIFRINSRFINKAEIARQLNISRSYASLILSGKRTNPEMVAKIKALIKEQLKAA